METITLKKARYNNERRFDYSDKKLDQIIKHGEWSKDGSCHVLRVKFSRLVCYGYTLYGKLYYEGVSTQVFYSESPSKCVRLAKDYLKGVELV